MDNPGFEMKDNPDKREPERNSRKSATTENNARNRSSTKPTQQTAVPVENEPRPPDEDLEEDGTANIFGRVVVSGRSALYNLAVNNKKVVNIIMAITAALLYHAYLGYAIYWGFEKAPGGMDWCNGAGILIIITGIVYWCLFYYFVIKGMFGRTIQRGIMKPFQRTLEPLMKKWYFSYTLGLLPLGGAIAFVVVDAWEEPRRLISGAGVVAVLAVCLLLSKHPGRVRWRQVFWGIGLQFLFALIILRWDGGRQVFDCISGKVKTFLDYSLDGSNFVYDYLSAGKTFNTTSDGETFTETSLNPIFVFKALSVIYFFSFFINILYYYGIMMWVISKLGWVLQVTIGTTAAESMTVAANIFVGQTEAPILIKPFLQDMTRSELHAVMTGGFATIAGGVMAAYISFGIDPSYLLSSSIMAAPAALAISKLIYPETKVSRTTAEQLKSISLKQEGNALDAAAAGATQGVMLIGNIVANIIAFMAFVAFLNGMVQWFGGIVGLEELSFEWILSKVFVPFAYIMGINDTDAEDVALLLGLKTVANEFVAYERLISPSMAHLSQRSNAIATYALCSFANFSSIGIQLGGIGFMAPNRRTDLTETIWYAFLAGSLTGILNACIAGTLLSGLSDDPFSNN